MDKEMINAIQLNYRFVCRTQYNCCFVFGYGKRAVCDNRNVLIIVY